MKGRFPRNQFLRRSNSLSDQNIHPSHATRDAPHLLISLLNGDFRTFKSELLYLTLKMYTSIYLLLFLLVSLRITVATADQEPLQRPISFSPPSQHPILTYLPRPDEPSLIRSTINVSSRGQQIPVTFSLSSQVCVSLIHQIQYIIADLSKRLLSEHLDGISFPSSPDPQIRPLPTYLEANITELVYVSKFVLSLSLKISPLESGLKGAGTPEWQSIIGLLEESALELDRNRDGAGLGSVLVLEAEIEEVHVLAKWMFWKIVDGLPVMCES
jgi:hypothetical protein